MSKYYAVKVGKNTGIYNTWEECKAQVDGYSNAQYKSFKTLAEASDYLNEVVKASSDHLVAYVDGSYNDEKKIYGYGCILLYHDQIICEYYGKGDNKENLLMRNVSGEIMGAIKAISYAIENNYSDIDLYYDYKGIENWATHKWQANKPGTKQYVTFIQESIKKINIHFYKVAAHTGDTYNEAVDLLAKKAVGITL